MSTRNLNHRFKIINSEIWVDVRIIIQCFCPSVRSMANHSVLNRYARYAFQRDWCHKVFAPTSKRYSCLCSQNQAYWVYDSESTARVSIGLMCFSQWIFKLTLNIIEPFLLMLWFSWWHCILLLACTIFLSSANILRRWFSINHSSAGTHIRHQNLTSSDSDVQSQSLHWKAYNNDRKPIT